MGARALRRVEAWVASLPFETRGFTEVLRGSGSFAALRVEVDFRDDAKIPDRPLVEGLFRRVGASVSIYDDGSIVAHSPKNGPTSTSSAPLYR
jgi:hypothetical protein